MMAFRVGAENVSQEGHERAASWIVGTRVEAAARKVCPNQWRVCIGPELWIERGGGVANLLE
jgi:hypothetical protein